MVDNVKPIMAGVEVPGQQNREVVAVLEKMLESAKQGELLSVAVCGHAADGCSMSSYVLGNHAFATLGALTYLTARVTTYLQEA